MTQKLLTMAYELKSNAKLGFENSYVNLTQGLISTEPFEGYQYVVTNEGITDICLKHDLDIDSDELIDRIVVALERLEIITNDITLKEVA